MAVRTGDTIDVHQLPTCAVLNRSQTNHFLMTVAAHGSLREKLRMAEKMNGKQLNVTAKLYGPNTNKTEVTADKEIEISSKIQKEKRRLAGYVD